MTTVTAEQLPKFVKSVAKKFALGDVVCLSGQMGAGKTTFLFHLLQYWKILPNTPFSSPTFSIQNIYETEKFPCVLHMDLFRLENFRSFVALDLLENETIKNAVTFIEWGEKFTELENIFTKKIIFTVDPQNEETREIKFL